MALHEQEWRQMAKHDYQNPREDERREWSKKGRYDPYYQMDTSLLASTYDREGPIHMTVCSM